MWRTLVLFFLLTVSARAQSYLPETTLAAAQTRSAAWCTVLHCDGVLTKYWWPVIALNKPDGTYNAYIKITPGDPCYGATNAIGCPISKTVAPNALSGLTPTEKSLLKTAAAVSPTFNTTTQNWARGQIVNLTAPASPAPRGEPLTYQLTGLPSWLIASCQMTCATITLTGTVPQASASFVIKIVAMDASGLSSNGTITVTVP